MFLAYAIISAFYSSVNLNKAGVLSSDVVLLSIILKRYYEPLRLPIQPDSVSLFAYMNPLVLQTPPHWISRPAQSIFRYMPLL